MVCTLRRKRRKRRFAICRKQRSAGLDSLLGVKGQSQMSEMPQKSKFIFLLCAGEAALPGELLAAALATFTRPHLLPLIRLREPLGGPGGGAAGASDPPAAEEGVRGPPDAAEEQPPSLQRWLSSLAGRASPSRTALILFSAPQLKEGGSPYETGGTRRPPGGTPSGGPLPQAP